MNEGEFTNFEFEVQNSNNWNSAEALYSKVDIKKILQIKVFKIKDFLN